MACRVVKDDGGEFFVIPTAKDVVTPGGKRLPGSPQLMAWWDRDLKNRSDENLLIRQENDTKKADVLSLTLAQAYDLHHALGCLIMRQ